MLASTRWRGLPERGLTMNLRVFLAASAALLGVVAAEAAEGDPADYVRVCDAYGTGFFTIPGTETCLQLSGYVWFQVGATNDDGLRTPNYMGFVADEFNLNVEGRLNIDARSETEMGTLRSYLRLQATWVGGGDAAVAMDQAYIQLGGLDMGYSESFYVDDHISGVGNYGSHSWTGLSYSYQQNARLGYRFKGGNGFFGVAAIEFDANPNYVPDFVLKAGVEQDWGGAALALAYDESDASFALKGTVQVNVPNMAGSSLIVMGQYTNSATNSYGATFDGGLAVPLWATANWSILASYNHQFNEKFGASVGLQYFDGFGAVNGWQAELSAVYTPVTNFEVRGELGYAKSTGLDGTLSGYVRFTRYF